MLRAAYRKHGKRVHHRALSPELEAEHEIPDDP
jgi:hypothetical protein